MTPRQADGKPQKSDRPPMTAERALGILGDPERTEADRIAAALRLGELKHLASIERLFAVRESAETYLARAIGEALRAMDAGAEVAKGLKSPDPGEREEAAERLLRLGDPRTEAAILAGLRDPEPRVRRALVQALARFDSDGAAAALNAALRDRHPSVRSMAAAGIGKGRDPAGAAALQAALEAETDDIARDFMERALQTLAR